MTLASISLASTSGFARQRPVEVSAESRGDGSNHEEFNLSAEGADYRLSGGLSEANPLANREGPSASTRLQTSLPKQETIPTPAEKEETLMRRLSKRISLRTSIPASLKDSRSESEDWSAHLDAESGKHAFVKFLAPW